MCICMCVKTQTSACVSMCTYTCADVKETRLSSTSQWMWSDRRNNASFIHSVTNKNEVPLRF
jgi:hypothetical protein